MPCPTIQELTKRIIKIWESDQRFISLCFFHHVPKDEAMSREACMIEAIGESSFSKIYWQPNTHFLLSSHSFLYPFLSSPSLPHLPPPSGLHILTNSNSGSFYGGFASLKLPQKQRFGIYFLYKAYHSYLDDSATLSKHRYGFFSSGFHKTL